MSSPSVRSYSGPTRNGSAGTQILNMPPAVVAGDLLIVFMDFQITAKSVTSWPTGWSMLAQRTTGDSYAIGIKTADGSEGGGTASFGLSAGSQMTYLTMSISGWSGTAPEATTATATSATPDPPSITPSWGSADDLIIAAFFRNASITLNNGPSGYSTPLTATATPALSVAYKGISAMTSEDPGAFSVTASTAWYSATVAVKGAALATNNPFFFGGP